jgi:hypothetical protein
MNGTSGENVERNGGFCQGKYNDGFSEVLQQLPNRKAIAADLGIPYGTLDNYIRGLQSFPPDLIARLFAITGEWSILEFILEPLDLHAVSKTRPNDIQKTDSPDVYRMLMDITERLGETTHEVRKAKADAKISPSEYGRIGYFLRDIERLCAGIRETIKSEVCQENHK